MVQKELKALVQETLLSDHAQARPFFRRKIEYNAMPASTMNNHGYRMWNLLILEMWMRNG